MNDQEFEDQAAIQIMAGLASSPNTAATLGVMIGETIRRDQANPAGFAEMVYQLANALLEERKKRPITPPLQNTVFAKATRPKP